MYDISDNLENNDSENMSWEEVLGELCMDDGVSGDERDIACTCAAMLEYYGEVTIDRSGNVHGTFGEQRGDRKTLLLNAHIDEIGMIVNFITDDGFLRVSKCGGIDERVLPAAEVTVLGREKLYGVFTSVPPHLSSESDKAASLDDLYVDIGMSGEAAKKAVSLGDRVLIENFPEQMGELVTSKALDDRVCVLAILMALDKLKRDADDGEGCAYNIKVLLSSGEETGGAGAATGAYMSEADLAIVLDVSFGRVHGESAEDGVGEIGGGAMIGISPVLSRRLSDALVKTAREEDLPYQLEIMGGRTGTDADAVAVTKGGIPACTVSVPIKYMHTPVESVNIADVENTAALIAAFCERGLF